LWFEEEIQGNGSDYHPNIDDDKVLPVRNKKGMTHELTIYLANQQFAYLESALIGSPFGWFGSSRRDYLLSGLINSLWLYQGETPFFHIHVHHIQHLALISFLQMSPANI